MSRHTDLVDAVNDANTEYEHTFAMGRLSGWTQAMEECGNKLPYLSLDNHSEARFPGRPLCCGVLLDWQPAKS